MTAKRLFESRERRLTRAVTRRNVFHLEFLVQGTDDFVFSVKAESNDSP
jgi:hypothetical protein